MKRIEKIGKWISSNELKVTIFCGLIASVAIIAAGYGFNQDMTFENSPNVGLYNHADFWENIIVESHGLLFDILFFGLVIGYFDYKRKKEVEKAQEEELKRRELARLADLDRREEERKQDIIRGYQEELEDFRGWKGEEAAFRVAGIVKRLLKEGIEDIDLSNLHVGQLVQIVGSKGKEMIEMALRENREFCSLEGASLREADLRGANLPQVNLRNANLWGANLQGARLPLVNLQMANLQSANLEGAVLLKANLEKVNLTYANLEGANLFKTNLENTRLEGANLRNANLSVANLQGADLFKTNLENASLLKVNLKGAWLINTNLQGANLKGADLNGAFLDEADLLGAEAVKYQREEFSEVMTKEQINSMIWLDDETAKPIESEESQEYDKNLNTENRRKILTGPKGGTYYLNAKGKKVYIRKE